MQKNIRKIFGCFFVEKGPNRNIRTNLNPFATLQVGYFFCFDIINGK